MTVINPGHGQHTLFKPCEGSDEHGYAVITKITGITGELKKPSPYNRYYSERLFGCTDSLDPLRKINSVNNKITC